MSSKRTPKLRRHKTHGLGIVTLNGNDHYLGKWPAEYRDPPAEVQAEYDRLIAEWLAGGRCLIKKPSSPSEGVSINELILVYYRFAEGYYRKNGKPTSQLERVRRSLRFVKELYGHKPANEFGPTALKAVREKMVLADWTRIHVNHCIGCVKRMFKWGVENEIVPPSIHQGLLCVPGLKKGRSAARESQKVMPVADEVVDATLPYLWPPVRAMVQVQRLTGMRPGEVVIMRPCDIDRGKPKVWVYRPDSHKTEHHGIERVVILGPQAQAILKPFLEGRHSGKCLFSPREAMEFRWEQMRKERKSKVQPSQVTRKQQRPRRQLKDSYSVMSYEQAIDYALAGANRTRAVANEILAALRAEGAMSFEAIGERQEGKPEKLLRKALNLLATQGLVVRAEETWAAQRDAADLPMIPHWHPHQLRHTLATEIRREAGLDAARAILGHRSPQITETYAEIDLGKAEEIMERLG